MTTLRAKVARDVALGVGLCAALGLVALYLILRAMFLAHFDDEVREDLRSIANVTNVALDGKIGVYWNTDVLTDFGMHGDKLFIVLNREASETIEVSPLLEGSDWRPSFAHPRGRPVLLDHTLADGRRFRLAGQRMDAQWSWDENTPTPEGFKDVEVVVIAGRDAAPLDTALQHLATLFVTAGLAFTLLAGLVAYWAARRGVAPLSRLTADLEVSRIEQRTREFDTSGPTEVGLVAGALNRQVGRIQMALARERRFLADAAHELNTPLAEMRTVNDVALLRPDDLPRLQHAAEVTREVALRLGDTLRALFALSRGESGRELPQRIELAPLFDELWGAASARYPQRDLRFACDLDAACYAPPLLLRGLLKNLVDNAAAYAPPGSEVRAVSREDARVTTITIENSAPELGAEDVVQMFEPFWRKDSARTARDHAGLGLALARSYADAMNVELEARLDADQVLRFTMRLPHP